MESWRWHRANTAAVVGGGGPCARTDHTGVLWSKNAGTEHLLVFGGSTLRGASDELWRLDCSSGAPEEWAWADETDGRNGAVRVGPWPPGN